MKARPWPVQYAEARFGEFLDACERDGPQIVTRRTNNDDAIYCTTGDYLSAASVSNA